ncbi:MAG: hypothetical protein K8T89_24420, partial [Planctomycetes bacterium]|nr:hypothetical protein [Planctomycetota bacterium]
MSQSRVPPGRRFSIRWLRLLLLAGFALGIAALPGRSDVIILKDGYSIHGKVGTEQTIITDKLSGESIITKKLNGLSTVDDGPRWTVFSANSKRVGEISDFNKFADFVHLKRPFIPITTSKEPALITLESQTEFDARWQRKQVFRSKLNPRDFYKIDQQIDILTPQYARFNSFTHVWASYYLTRELGPELVRRLLSTHPDFIEKDGKADVGKRAKLIRFLIQAEWLNEAEEEVDRLIKDLPAESKRAEELRDDIKEVRLEQSMVEIERARAGGRHGFAQSTLKRLPKEQVPAKFTVKVAGFKAEYEATSAKFNDAKRHLGELSKQAGPSFKDLTDAADFISAELHLDTTSRLDLFLTLAEQAEVALKAQKKPIHTPEQLLSAAICGWLMGNTSTETKVDVARSRLKAREVALKYLRESNSAKRRDMFTEYQKDKDTLPFDELEKLISLLPPPEAEKEIPTGPVTRNSGPLPSTTVGVSYLLQLPPEYQHGRSYPLLIILGQGGERPSDTLKKFGDLPARYGFIVAVLEWGAGFESSYNYTEEEQVKVTG